MKNVKFLVFAVLIFILQSCNQNAKFYTISGNTQGTTYQVKYSSNSEITQTEIDSVLKFADIHFSIYDPNSMVSAINQNKNPKLDEWFISLYTISKNCWEKSYGYFDVTVGPLVRFWGFGSDSLLKKDSLVLDSIRNLVGMNKISIKDNYLIKVDSLMYIDLNAIAQGHTVDLIADFLESKEIKNYLVEIGGEVRTLGRNHEDKDWKIGIDKPLENSNELNRELQEIVSVSGFSIATSGSYRKFMEKDGIKYSHTINPKTGYPSHHQLLSVTITAPTCGEADALATAIMAMGIDEGRAFLKKYPQHEGYFIFSDSLGAFQTWMTSGFEKYIVKE